MSEDKLILKSEKITAHRIFYHDFENYIMSVYDKYFDFVEDQESGNGFSHEYLVKDDNLDFYENKKLEEWIAEGNHNFVTRILLKDLCKKGFIESGYYIIRVSW